jgi:hypothetical protein
MKRPGGGNRPELISVYWVSAVYQDEDFNFNAMTFRMKSQFMYCLLCVPHPTGLPLLGRSSLWYDRISRFF